MVRTLHDCAGKRRQRVGFARTIYPFYVRCVDPGDAGGWKEGGVYRVEGQDDVRLIISLEEGGTWRNLGAYYPGTATFVELPDDYGAAVAYDYSKFGCHEKAVKELVKQIIAETKKK